MPVSLAEFTTRLVASGMLTNAEINAFINRLPADKQPADGDALARELVRQQVLTKYQAQMVHRGKTRSLVLNDYVLLDQIGKGGMGMVFKARHKRMKRVVALKILSPSAIKSPDSVARFHREVEAAARLSHPHIVTAFDAGEKRGVHYLVMELVDGSDLAKLVRERGPFPANHAADIVRQAAAGLGYAHKNGVVHRDVKPSNLLLTKEGLVKILDMGLARLDNSAPRENITPLEDAAPLTHSGQVMGTLDFMAPEQALDTHKADARADIYSLGATLHYLLTGRLLFHGQTCSQKMLQLLAAQQAPPNVRSLGGDVPAGLEAVCHKMTSWQAEERYQSMAEVIAALDASLSRPAPATANGGATGTKADGAAVPASGQVHDALKADDRAEDRQPATLGEPALDDSPADDLPAWLAAVATIDALDNAHPPAVDAAEPTHEYLSDPHAPTEARERPQSAIRPGRRALAIAAGLVLLGALFAAPVIIRIRNKDGSTTELKVDNAESIAVEQGGKRLADVVLDKSKSPTPTSPEPVPAKPPATTADAIDSAAERKAAAGLMALQKKPKTPLLVGKGQPLSPQATVSRPAAIPGVRSWSVEPASHSAGVWSVAWSLTGDVLATAGRDDFTIRLWDRNGVLRKVLLGHDGHPVSVSFSADGSLLASCDELQDDVGRGSLRLWDVATGQCLNKVSLPGWGQSLAFAPAGRRVAVGGRGGVAMVIDLDGGTAVPLDRSGPLAQFVCWSPDGKHLLGGDGNGRPAIWDAASGSIIGELPVPDWPDGKPRLSKAVGWSPDGKWLAVGSVDGNIRIWDATTRQHVRTIATGTELIQALAWNRDSHEIAAACEGGPWVVCNVTDGKITAKAKGRDGNARNITWSPDGTELAFHPDNGTLTFADPATGKAIRQAPKKRRFYPWLSHELFLPNGSLRVTAHDPAGLREFDPETGALRLDQMRNRPNLDWLAASAQDGSSDLYQAGEKEASVIEPAAAVPRVTLRFPAGAGPFRYDPAGKRLAAPAGNLVIVWSATTGAKERESPHPAKVLDASWSPDGSRIATTCDDKAIRVWDMATGKLLATSAAQPQLAAPRTSRWSQTMAWEPDGRTVWAGLQTSIVRLDVLTGRGTVYEGFSNGGWIHSLALAADGDSLLVCESYGWTFLRTPDGTRRLLGQHLVSPVWHPDARRFVGEWLGVRAFDTRTNRRLGVLHPWFGADNEHWVCIGPDGHFRGSDGADEHLVVTAQLEDGSNVTLPPAAFAKRFGWKNDPNKARLLALDHE